MRFPIFDPRPVFALVNELYPARGSDLTNLWRVRQFEYGWLRTMSGGYADFWQATGDALSFAATALKLDLPPGKRASLRDGYRKPGCWPDVTAALRSLKSAGIRLAILSN